MNLIIINLKFIKNILKNLANIGLVLKLLYQGQLLHPGM